MLVVKWEVFDHVDHEIWYFREILVRVNVFDYQGLSTVLNVLLANKEIV